MRTFIQQHPTRMLAGLVLLGFAIPSVGLAQQADTVRRDAVQSATSPSATRPGERDRIYLLGKGVYTDTLRRNEFKAVASDVAELDDCDTTLQSFVLVRRLSPWRIGLFAGPNFAYCGTWENTFGPNRRDNSLYNGAGFNITGNVDYYLTPATRRLRFGLGTAFGYQNYITRGVYRDFLYGLAAARGFTRDQVTIRQRASEDMFLTIGPVLQFTLARSRRNPDAATFIELGARGGLFRTEAATIAAYIPSLVTPPNIPAYVDGGGLLRTVNPSSRLYHLGGLLSLGVFFPLRNNWNIGVQAQGFYTRLNYLIVNGIDDQLYEFTRKHGGFSAGLAVRKGFVQRKLIPKAPVVCPTCDSIPQLRVQFNGNSLNGVSLAYTDNATNTSAAAPIISFRSNQPNPRNLTYTARLHYRPDSVTTGNADQIIAQLEQSTDTTLAFPAAYFTNGQIRPGHYTVTVHSNQSAKCGSCMSDVALASFSSLVPPPPSELSRFRHRLERLEVFYRTPGARDFTSICYCNGEITGKTIKKNRLFYRNANYRLASGAVEFDTNTVILNLRDIPGDLASTLAAEKSKIENGAGIRYKGRRVRPQVSYFRAVFTVTRLPINGQPEQPVGSFNTIISDNSMSITDLKPLTELEKQNLLNPAPVKKRARRGGNSGRRSDVTFGID